MVREVQMRTLSRGLGMKEQNGHEWEMRQFLALVASTEERLQRLVDEFGVVYEKKKLNVNVR